MERISRTELFLSKLQITAPITGGHLVSEIGKRLARIAALYIAAAFAGALIVAIGGALLHIQSTGSDESNNILLIRAVSGICAAIVLFVLIHRISKKAPR